MAAPIQEPVADSTKRFSRAWIRWIDRAEQTIASLRETGPTTSRPTRSLWVGRQYFDTTLGHPVWYDGTQWVDATGTTA